MEAQVAVRALYYEICERTSSLEEARSLLKSSEARYEAAMRHLAELEE